MQCICCNLQKAVHQKRGLCNSCYTWLQNHNRINEFPPIFPLKKSLRWQADHGDELIADLKMLVDDNNITLEAIAQKYNLTRERIRQMFELFYGFKYTVVKNIKRDKNKRRKYELRMAKRNPEYKINNYPNKDSLIYKGALAEKKVFDICATLGYEIKPSENFAIDLIINGYKVEVKSAYVGCFTTRTRKSPQYHFQILKSQISADFIVCYAVPPNNFFVIPISEWPKGRHLYIPSIKTTEWNTGRAKRISTSKYYDFLEAWHLLKRKPD